MTKEKLKRATALYRRLEKLRADVRNFYDDEFNVGNMYAAGVIITIYDSLEDAALELETLIDLYENND